MIFAVLVYQVVISELFAENLFSVVPMVCMWRALGMFQNPELSRFIRFAFVGTIFLGLGVLILYVLVEFLKLEYLLAYVISFVILNLGSYVINKRFSFRLNTALRRIELVRYYLVALSGVLLGMALMWGLVERVGMHYLPASIFVGFLCAVFNYAGHALFTFGRNLRRRHENERI